MFALWANHEHQGAGKLGFPSCEPVGGALAGIGFTVSLLIAELPFDAGSHTDYAKIAILAGSTIAAITGATLLTFRNRHHKAQLVRWQGVS